MFDFKNKRILVLAPHTDDGEFGCGGLISKAIRLGATVNMATFSICEESVPHGLPKDILHKECLNSVGVLGINKLYDFRFKVRRFNEDRQNILEEMIKIRKDFNPDIILLPSTNDIHQDHEVISQEGIRAFKTKSIFGYILPWNNLITEDRLNIVLSNEDVMKKIESIMQYESQNFRVYSDSYYLENHLKMNGYKVGEEFCEVYELIRLKS